MMGRGVAAGATTPTQVKPVKPGRPASALVGTSGMAGSLFSTPTSRGRTLPVLSNSIAAAGSTRPMSSCDDITANSTSLTPL